MTAPRGVSAVERDRLLSLSREARWSFPSSAGSPVHRPTEPWVASLLEERESLVRGVRLLVEEGNEEAATEIAANVWRLWIVAGDVAGGRAFLASVLDRGHGPPSRERALALYGDGLLALMEGSRDESRKRNDEALEAARASGDREALALAHLGLSRVFFLAGDYRQARVLAANAREFARGRDPAVGQAPLHMQAQATRLCGEDDEAAALLGESLELNRRLGDEGMVAVELHNLGHVELHRGNVDLAERYFAECAELGSAADAYGEAMTSLNEAALAFARGDPERAASLLAESRSILADAGAELAPDDQLELERLGEQLADAAR